MLQILLLSTPYSLALVWREKYKLCDFIGFLCSGHVTCQISSWLLLSKFRGKPIHVTFCLNCRCYEHSSVRDRNWVLWNSPQRYHRCSNLEWVHGSHPHVSGNCVPHQRLETINDNNRGSWDFADGLLVVSSQRLCFVILLWQQN